MKTSTLIRLAQIATVLAIVVVLLGAYTRLSDAGLGCPDWPGCYGHLDVPKTQSEISAANQAYPDRPVEGHKAWKEMIHRYFAGTLGLLVFAIAIITLILRRRQPDLSLKVPLFLAVFIIFQALLGMWTVTLKLKPVIVMLHLLGGLTTLSLLWWLYLRHSRKFQDPALLTSTRDQFRRFALVGLIIVVIQISLGGWTSANYAALHCTDFPTCQGHWLPPLDIKEAFTLWRGTNKNYEFGVLDNDARVTIHFTHRVGALITLLFIGWLSFMLWRNSGNKLLRNMSKVMAGVLLVQILLGIGNVLLSLPLLVAVAHNGVAALLLLILVTLNHTLRPVERN